MSDNFLYFALCPHCNTAEELSIWKQIVEKISDVIGRKISLKTFSSFSDLHLAQQNYDFYYANPELAIELIKKDYIVLGKLRDESESLCSIVSKSYSPEKDVIKVALLNQKYFLLPLLFHKKEYKRFQFVFVTNYNETINLVRENKVDIGIIYSKFGERLKHDKEIIFSDDFCFPIFHFILMKRSLEEFKDKILSIQEVQNVSVEEIEHLKTLYNQLEIMLQDWAHHDISQALISSPNIGVIIYHEKILFCNDYTKNLLGYTEDELYNMRSFDIIYPEDRQNVIENANRRLRGEKFSRIYNIRFQKKDGSVIFVECLANTILFRGLYSGFIIFYDITSKKYNEKFKEILMEVNKIITQAMTEEEIYDRICKNITEKLNLKLAGIGIVDRENNRIIPDYYYVKDNSILEHFDYCMIKNSILETILSKGEIVISSYPKEDTQTDIKSSCIIPFFKYNNVVSFLHICSEFPQFFNETNLELLKEIQYDISFALERVERIRHNTIIAEALKNSDTWILVTDENGNILYVNEAVEKISGYTKDELIGQNPRIFKSGLNPPEFYKEMWDTITSGKIFNAITPNRKKDGEIFHADLKIIPVRLPGNILRFVAVARDVTEKVKLSERIQRLQNYDALTGLLNMNGFAVNVTQKLHETESFGLFILIDIHDMTYINKMYGIYTGDKILIEFAEKIRKYFGNSDTLARIGADTFGMYLIVESSEDIYKVYSKLYELNNSVFDIGDKIISININAAISVFPKDGKSFKTLYERADITLQDSKKIGAGTIQFFDASIEKEAEKLWKVFNLIKKASEERLFTFYYQPYYHTTTSKIAGFEALVRIIDTDGKLYTPDFFIDYLENSQYLNSFERWAIQKITERIKKWRVNISLNISGKAFTNPILIPILSEIPEEIRDKLTIEITERIFVNNLEYAIDILNSIKHMPIPPKIAIDDFGTGYSSMSYLRDLPIDIVKIDKAFIKDMVKDKKSLIIVQTIIELAKKLEKLTLAEGVETEEQFNILKNLGCDFVQGFLFSKPLPEEEIETIFLIT